jgi:hypothetical protein
MNRAGPTRSDLLLGIPHAEIPNILENAAIQAGHGRNANGLQTVVPSMANSFRIGRSAAGEPVLTMVVGRAGTISFMLLPTWQGG